MTNLYFFHLHTCYSIYQNFFCAGIQFFVVLNSYEIYKKGLGNNTNIFPIVIQDFPLIDISLDEQQRIVDEIHSEIAKQEDIKKQIADLRNQIDCIIEDAITKGDE